MRVPEPLQSDSAGIEAQHGTRNGGSGEWSQVIHPSHA
jgi:hypothetical protein